MGNEDFFTMANGWVSTTKLYYPEHFESYVSIKCINNDPELGPTGTLNYRKLIEILNEQTNTPKECYMALWNGFGWRIEEQESYLFSDSEKPFKDFFNITNRSYYLFKGSLDESQKIGHRISDMFIHEQLNMIWPSDKAWFLSKEIDFDVCLIGGSKDLIKQIVDSGYFVTESFEPNQLVNEIFISDTF